MSEQPKTERCQESLQRQPDGSLLCPSCGWVVEAYPTKAARSIPSGAELPVLTVLRELVALKDLKDSWRARSDTGETPNEQDFDYYKRKPLAWEAARALLADPSRGERD